MIFTIILCPNFFLFMVIFFLLDHLMSPWSFFSVMLHFALFTYFYFSPFLCITLHFAFLYPSLCLLFCDDFLSPCSRCVVTLCFFVGLSDLWHDKEPAPVSVLDPFKAPSLVKVGRAEGVRKGEEEEKERSCLPPDGVKLVSGHFSFQRLYLNVCVKRFGAARTRSRRAADGRRHVGGIRGRLNVTGRWVKPSEVSPLLVNKCGQRELSSGGQLSSTARNSQEDPKVFVKLWSLNF